MNKITEIQYRVLIVKQRNALKLVLLDSQYYMILSLIFFAGCFAAICVKDGFNGFAYGIALFTVCKLFSNAMNAAEVGL